MSLAEVITFVKFVLPWTLPEKGTRTGEKFFFVARRFVLCMYMECGSSELQIRVTVKFFS